LDPHGRIRVQKVEPALMGDAVKQVHARPQRGGFTGLVGPVDDVKVGRADRALAEINDRVGELITRISTFCSSRCVAKLCRNVCGATQLGSPAISAAMWQTRLSWRVVIGLMRSPPGNIHTFGCAMEPLEPFPLASPARFSRSLQEPG